ncbi:MAG: hypothetical protein RDV48_18890 [Candidatus Eremiobacteraeota bacterium]|nr:hypothetical protein [Candidatus Eremiobacteraeota bacterium]
MKRLVFFLILLGVLFAAPGPSQAKSEYLLFQTIGDPDKDGVLETIQITSGESADPRKETSKSFKIRKEGKIVYERDLGTAPFSVDKEAMHGGLDTGIHLRVSKGKYPEIFIVFSANSDYCCWFQFDGKTYKIKAP